MNGYEKQSLSDLAVMYIKEKILSGEFMSGDKLIESEISEILDISRAPVREAMRILNEQGIIVFSPRKGNFVHEMSRCEVMEVFDIRICLEESVLELLVEGNILKDEDFANLYDIVDKMRSKKEAKLALHERIYQLNTMDLEFHRYLWSASKSTLRGKLSEGLFYQLLIAMNRNVSTLGTFYEKANEHMQIVQALEKKNVTQAIKLFKKHLTTYAKAYNDMVVEG